MSDVLCSFPGKFGDIIWSLATAREISRLTGQRVDFKVMPYYERLVPLLQAQDYIDKAEAVPDWIRTHSNHGDGPGIPPLSAVEGYGQVYHLAYKGHPGINAPNMPLIDFVAYQQGIKFTSNPVPFLTAPTMKPHEKQVIAYSFNEQYEQQKQAFFTALRDRFSFCNPDLSAGVEFVNINTLPWLEAASEIQGAALYVGCRSGCWVIAMGLGKQTMTYEPHPARNRFGSLGQVFGCPYGQELPLPLQVGPQQCAEIGVRVLAETVQRVKSVAA